MRRSGIGRAFAAAFGVVGLVAVALAGAGSDPSTEHAVRAGPAGHRAHNPGQGWDIAFDGSGVSVTPQSGGWLWGLELARYGRGRSPVDVALPCEVGSDGSRLEYRWDDRLSEWYVNEERGLEHGFTLHERPSGDGALELELRIRGGLRPMLSADRRDVRFVDASGLALLDYTGLVVFDATGRRLGAGWESRSAALHLIIDDRDAHYPLTIDPIAQMAYLKASNTGAGDNFGTAVAVSGDTAVVGARREDSNATGVGGNELDDSLWDPGAAYVFIRSGTTWTQQAYLKPSNSKTSWFFGHAVAIDGDIIVVGAPLDSSGSNGNEAGHDLKYEYISGAAYVFEREGSAWLPKASLKSPQPTTEGYFGWSVAVHGDTILVGAPGEAALNAAPIGHKVTPLAQDAGVVYVFKWQDGAYSLQSRITAPNAGEDDAFGWALDFDGHTLVVGAPNEAGGSAGVGGDLHDDSLPGAGAAYVYSWNGMTWTFEAYVKAVNPGYGDKFGASLSLSADTLVVGSYGEDSMATGVNGDPFTDSWTTSWSGAAYVFDRLGTTWSQVAYLKASNSAKDLYFGGSVAVEGEHIVVGARGEHSKATGIHGKQYGGFLWSSGAAYLFQKVGPDWKQTAFIKASNTDQGDGFGAAVALQGGTLLIGAPAESSAATGVDGDQQDDSAYAAGAVYAFDLVSDFTPYCAQTKPTSVPGCFALLSCSDPTLATGSWQATNIPRSTSAGPGTSLGVFLYTHGVDIGASLVSSTPSYGLLCLSGFQASAPAYRPAILENAVPGICNSGVMSTVLAPAAAALGLAVGDDVNVQLWYRDPDPPANSRLSNAIHYTLK